MQYKGRTVLLIVVLTMILSSLGTMLVLGTTPVETNEHLEAGKEEKKEEQSQTPSDSEEIEQKFSKVKEAYEIIRHNYVLDVEDASLLEGAIEGMLNTLEDPYSVYMNPETAEDFKASLESSFEGIGAEVMMQNGHVTIVAPIRGTPAERAGIRPNDQIISVNGENIEGLELHNAVLKIRGPKGSDAVLEIIRPGVSDPLTITVTRDEIPINTVYTERLNVDGKTIGKVEITSFAQKTAEDFEEALEEFEKEGIDGLIIDVRGNPGGYFDAVRQIGQKIVPNKNVIAKMHSREGEIGVYKSTLNDPKPYPITVLIDHGSASASEILAAALQESGNYQVVGLTSFGKGTVQSTVQMEDDSEIKLTIAKWLTPNDNWIHGEGVEPDVRVEQPEYFQAIPINVSEETLKKDMNSNQVKNLQLILKGLGYDPGREDGFFNEETEVAVRSFQAKHQLDSTGIVDEETAVLLQEKLIEEIRDPKNDAQLQKAVEVILEQSK